jgi:hypothetical protein
LTISRPQNRSFFNTWLKSGDKRQTFCQAQQQIRDKYKLPEILGRFCDSGRVKTGQQIEYALPLRDAKRKIHSQKQGTAPYFWAAFVLYGER